MRLLRLRPVVPWPSAFPPRSCHSASLPIARFAAAARSFQTCAEHDAHPAEGQVDTFDKRSSLTRHYRRSARRSLNSRRPVSYYPDEENEETLGSTAVIDLSFRRHELFEPLGNTRIAVILRADLLDDALTRLAIDEIVIHLERSAHDLASLGIVESVT